MHQDPVVVFHPKLLFFSKDNFRDTDPTPALVFHYSIEETEDSGHTILVCPEKSPPIILFRQLPLVL